MEFLMVSPHVLQFFPCCMWWGKNLFSGHSFARPNPMLPFYFIFLTFVGRQFFGLLHHFLEALNLFLTQLYFNCGLSYCNQLLDNYFILFFLFGFILLLGFGLHHNHVLGINSFEAICLLPNALELFQLTLRACFGTTYHTWFRLVAFAP